MERKVLNEITPLGVHDFMYVADRHKQEMDYPIHYHNVMELNFVENAAGCRRVVGDHSEVAAVTEASQSGACTLQQEKSQQ